MKIMVETRKYMIVAIANIGIRMPKVNDKFIYNPLLGATIPISALRK